LHVLVGPCITVQWSGRSVAKTWRFDDRVTWHVSWT